MRIIFYILLILNSIFGSVYTVTKSSDTNDGICDKDCSLREAVVAANKHEGFDVIKIPAGEYKLTIKGLKELYGEKGDLNINDDLYIMGDGKDKTVITGTKDDRVFYIDTFSKGKKVKLFDLTVRNGKSDYGGGILSNGDLTLENVKITDNEANNGGGILSSSSLTIQNCDILNNSAITTGELSNGFGGGVFAKKSHHYQKLHFKQQLFRQRRRSDLRQNRQQSDDRTILFYPKYKLFQRRSDLHKCQSTHNRYGF